MAPERRPWVGAALEVAAVLGVFVVLGALAGVVWEWVWTPPTGLVYHHRWYPDEQGLHGIFSATGWYLLIGLVTGLVAGALSTLLFHRHEVVVLLAVVAGSLLGGFVMWHVGVALGPADPRHAAATLADYKPLPGALRTSGDSYRVAVPMGALLAAGAVFLGLSGRSVHRP